MPDERNNSMTYLDWFLNTADVYNYRNRKYSIRMQTEAVARRSPPSFMANPYNCNGDCYSVKIERSTFREFGHIGVRSVPSASFVKQDSTTSILPNTYQGKILSFDNFMGPITILDS